MKIWIKLSILLTIIINIIIQVVWLIAFPKIEENSNELIGEKLKSIAVAVANSISGDDYEKLNFSNPQVIFDEKFNEIRNHLILLKNNLNINEDIYTLNLVNEDSAQFGIMTNSKLFAGEYLHLKSKIAKDAILNTYRKDLCTYTDLYEDQFGEWITGLAPIKNSAGKIVGIIQVDHSSKTVSQKISSIKDFILWLQLILIPFIIFLSIILSKYFTAPIYKVIGRINSISKGDYSKGEIIKASGEIKDLVLSAETLRQRLLEQQEALLSTISELKEAIKKAEASDRLKGEFLSVLSHEIRTPLNVILGNVEILKMELTKVTDKDFSEFINQIRYGSLRLIRTIELIVLYSELATNNFNLSIKYLKIQDIVNEIYLKHKSVVQKNGVTIKYDCTSTASRVKADEKLIYEAVEQIVDNAVKFTKVGTVKICINESEKNGLSLLVEDTGIGISKQFMKDLFKPFKQEDMSNTRMYEGIGLGLALSKKIIDVLEYNITIESEKNVGTKVEIIIPPDKLFNL